jgi:hypothetical protein
MVPLNDADWQFTVVLIPILAFICRYLQKDKVSGPEGNTLFYELAERALDGPVNERVKEYISQVLISIKQSRVFH